MEDRRATVMYSRAEADDVRLVANDGRDADGDAGRTERIARAVHCRTVHQLKLFRRLQTTSNVH